MSRKTIRRKLLLLNSDTGFPAVFADRAQPVRHGQRQKVVLMYKQRVNHKQCKFSIYAMAKDTSVSVVTVGPDVLVLKIKKMGYIFRIFNNLMAIVNAIVMLFTTWSLFDYSMKLASRAMGSQVYHCGDYENKMRQKCQQSRLIGASQTG